MRLTPFLLTQNLAVDNALSTIQVIHQLINQMNKIIDTVNSIDSKANQYTDEQITNLKNELVSKIEKDVSDLKETLISYIDTQDNSLKVELLKILEDKVVKIYSDVEKIKNDLYLYIDTNDNEIMVKLYDMYNELLNLILNGNNYVYSAVDGNLKSVRDVMYDVMDIVQQKNGVSWKTLEDLCNVNYDLTGFVKPNDDIEIYVEKYGTESHIDYLNVNGLYIVCNNAIKSVSIDDENVDIFIGGGVLIPLTYFNKFLTDIVIVDVNSNKSTYKVANLDYVLKPVTYDSWIDKLNTLNKFNNWYSLAFYTCVCLQESLTRLDGTPVNIYNQPQFISLLNDNFYNVKGE